MIDLEVFVADLAGRGIQLIAEGDGLIAKPRQKLTDADRQAIRARKAEILGCLRAAEVERVFPGAKLLGIAPSPVPAACQGCHEPARFLISDSEDSWLCRECRQNRRY